MSLSELPNLIKSSINKQFWIMGRPQIIECAENVKSLDDFDFSDSTVTSTDPNFSYSDEKAVEQGFREQSKEVLEDKQKNIISGNTSRRTASVEPEKKVVSTEEEKTGPMFPLWSIILCICCILLLIGGGIGAYFYFSSSSPEVVQP